MLKTYLCVQAVVRGVGTPNKFTSVPLKTKQVLDFAWTFTPNWLFGAFTRYSRCLPLYGKCVKNFKRCSYFPFVLPPFHNHFYVTFNLHMRSIIGIAAKPYARITLGGGCSGLQSTAFQDQVGKENYGRKAKKFL